MSSRTRMRLQPGQLSALLGKRPRMQIGRNSGKKFLELLNSKVSPVICVSSDFKTIASRLRYSPSARLLSMLIAISGVGGGAWQDAYAKTYGLLRRLYSLEVRHAYISAWTCYRSIAQSFWVCTADSLVAKSSCARRERILAHRLTLC